MASSSTGPRSGQPMARRLSVTPNRAWWRSTRPTVTTSWPAARIPASSTVPTAAHPGPCWTTWDGGLTYVITFTGSSVINGSIADGVYDLQLDGTKVHDSSGQGLASNYVFTFFRLYGDFNGDGAVNNADFFQFRKTFNLSS